MNEGEHRAGGKGRRLPIYRYDVKGEAKVLRQPSQPVRRIRRSLDRLIEDMLTTMYRADGVGLAAPQVGVNKRVIVVDVGEGPIVLINPEIQRSEGSVVGLEGCLSIPDLMGEVERAERVTVQGLDRRGRKIWVEGEGLLARALQHEIDHLDGVLFLDRAQRLIEIPPEKRLRIIFMGTPDFSVPVLERLLEDGFRVRAVVTQPDRPRGRGLRPRPSPVKRLAEEVGLEVLQPERAKDPEFIARLRELEPDVIITCAFGQILPADVLHIPKLACMNVHASLLPRYRGAAPIQRALMDGVEETGVTLIYMDEGMDTGDICMKRRIDIEPEDTFGTLHDKLSRLAAEMLPDALRLLVSEQPPPRIPQDDAEASYAPRLQREETWIDWQRPAQDIVNHIRALDPLPGARTLWRGRMLKLYRVSVDEESRLEGGGAGTVPGRIEAIHDQAMWVAAGDGCVVIRELQPEGRRRMDVASFRNGYGIQPGDLLETPASRISLGKEG